MVGLSRRSPPHVGQRSGVGKTLGHRAHSHRHRGPRQKTHGSTGPSLRRAHSTLYLIFFEHTHGGSRNARPRLCESQLRRHNASSARRRPPRGKILRIPTRLRFREIDTFIIDTYLIIMQRLVVMHSNWQPARAGGAEVGHMLLEKMLSFPKNLKFIQIFYSSRIWA